MSIELRVMNLGLKLLLVDDRLEERSTLRRLIESSEINVTAIEECGAGIEAHSVAQELGPDIILVAFEEPIARSLKTIENLANLKPGLVVAYSSLSDTEYLRRAMRSGAREYLVKPLKARELAQTILDVLEGDRRRQALAETEALQGDVYTIIGPKGGIGKTTLATSLAIGLASETKQRVALVDLASQLGDVAMMMDIVPERTMADMGNLTRLLEPEIVESFLSSHSSGVKVLAASTEVNHNGFPSPGLISQIVECLTKSYDYVVIDGDQLLTPTLLAVLEMSTIIVLVTSTEITSIKNTKVFLEILRSQGFSDDKVKLVVNYPHQNHAIPPGEASKVLQYPIFWKIPFDNTCTQTTNMGQSFILARPKAKISQNILQLARSISGLHTKKASHMLNALVGRLGSRR